MFDLIDDRFSSLALAMPDQDDDTTGSDDDTDD